MQQVACDLHVHSCLSPCADITMLPGEVWPRLRRAGISIAALTDHNAACNVGVFERVFSRHGILLVPGMEVTTSEEVHVLCYFESVVPLWRFSRALFAAYPRVLNNPELFGYQLVCTEYDDFVGHFPFLLSMASLLSLGQLQDLVTQFGGVAVPSHVERRNGLLYQLGVVTEGMQFPTYEVARPADAAAVARQLPDGAQFISSSDSHALDMIGPPHCALEIESISVPEVLLALRHEGGRRVRFL